MDSTDAQLRYEDTILQVEREAYLTRLEALKAKVTRLERQVLPQHEYIPPRYDEEYFNGVAWLDSLA